MSGRKRLENFNPVSKKSGEGQKDHFDRSLRALKDPEKAFWERTSFADTLTLVSQTVQGWANTFSFCTDDRLMSSLDSEISIRLREYSAALAVRLLL